MQAGRQQTADARLCHDDAPMTRPTRRRRDPRRRPAPAGSAGADKSRLVVGGRSIIVRQLEVLQRVAHRHLHRRPRRGSVRRPGPARASRICVAGAGRLGGIYTALEVAHADPRARRRLRPALPRRAACSRALVELRGRARRRLGAIGARRRAAPRLLRTARAGPRARRAHRRGARSRPPTSATRSTLRSSPARKLRAFGRSGPAARQRQHAGGLRPDRIASR